MLICAKLFFKATLDLQLEAAVASVLLISKILISSMLSFSDNVISVCELQICFLKTPYFKKS